MRPGAVSVAVRGGLTRRRVQTAVIGLVLLVSAGGSVLGLALAADSFAPFDRAFAAQHGADVVAAVDSARVTPARLTATARLPQVTAAAGPFAEVTSALESGGEAGCSPAPGCRGHAAHPLPPLTLAGRAGPGGPVDDVILQSGRWARRPGELVLSSTEVYPEGDLPPGVGLGTRLEAAGLPGHPQLTVVGVATSVTGSADGWVTPAEIGRLRPAGTPPVAQMLYRFRSAGTDAAVRADIAAVTAALPRGAVDAAQSYLAVRAQQAAGPAPIAPFLVAFGLTGLLMSVLIVINVVSGAVTAGYRRIGVLKSIGFTPGQVVAAYTGQAMAPAAAGCLAGVVVGNLLAPPLLGRAAEAYRVGSLGVPAWVDVTIPAVLCGLVGIAALVPALRAGRLSAVQAIAAGRAPGPGRGYAAHRLLGRVWLPRPVTIGLAAPFARPARTAVTLVVVLLGATAVTLMAGLSGSLSHVVYGLSLAKTEQVQVTYLGPAGAIRVGPGGGPAPGPPAGPPPSGPQQPMGGAEQRTVTAALRAQPGTLHYVAEADEQASMPGVAGQIQVTALRGNAGWTGYGLISGRWYSGPGQADVPTYFLNATGQAVGDTVTITLGGRPIPVRIVGEIFDYSGLEMITDWRTLARADPGLAASMYDVGLRPGTSAAGYAGALGAALGSGYLATVNRNNKGLPVVLGLIGTLTLLLAVVAGLGVFNTVVVATSEHRHALGVFKAVGMTPAQAVTMVVCWVAASGLAAGVIAIPAGIGLQRYLVPVFAADAGTRLPASYLDVYPAWEIAALALAGVVIAVAGALLPAGWAAGTRTAAALRAE
ncbi:MAG TPA: FtsX-like permease family protein [Streptosporangiaceae bacterium]|nr:FtsX-like permease family protein [Streptosporangiaceae bacterium]